MFNSTRFCTQFPWDICTTAFHGVELPTIFPQVLSHRSPPSSSAISLSERSSRESALFRTSILQKEIFFIKNHHYRKTLHFAPPVPLSLRRGDNPVHPEELLPDGQPLAPQASEAKAQGLVALLLRILQKSPSITHGRATVIFWPWWWVVNQNKNRLSSTVQPAARIFKWLTEF